MRIDLDAALRECLQQPPWTESDALAAAAAIGREYRLAIEYEPGDEEWIRLTSAGARVAMISVRCPIVLATGHVAAASQPARCTIARVDDFATGHLRADPELLRRTVLRNWAADFDTEGFSPDDLFIESV